MAISDLIKQFNLLQTDKSCLFMLRHAEKYITEDIHDEIQQTITQNGIIRAKQLGLYLSQVYPKMGVVRSSPITRCLDTANNIFSIYRNNEITIIPDTLLGGDGAYVSDNQQAMKNFSDTSSIVDVFVSIQEGHILPGMRNRQTGTKLLLRRILQDLKNSSNPGFYITHDCILALFVGTLLERLINRTNWFQYLDGICIKRFNNRINLYWAKEVIDITDKVKELMKVI